MIDLDLTDPLAGVSPLQAPGVTLMVAGLGPLTLILPFRGKEDAVGAALGAELPAPGRSVQDGDRRITWFGKEAWLVSGAAVEADLSGLAAVTDQSDGWVAATLDGPAAREVLARLTPLDLRPTAFPVGAAARSELGHMPAAFIRTGEDRFAVMTFRSMAGTFWHELADAVRGVAARRGG
ncbi:sarcosine oxidase subunit gamma [Pseudaestuariivita atlantica]|uniref:Sarcosine oxidase subunit gamma n=1 Tax=Pseudaestuariivita atlantica TaxID=1317121 RepID=A0A0L1JMJ8_9RHOB|nr:sarcosine oxidase subunit gamma family protein [Pseudaestuariivita atlantica]KNG92648.1 hypothetical protein ATO11_16670 [Pseudaestuariivita atlantica]